MASDVVEFQRQTFLTCFEEVKPRLPDTLASEFEQIKNYIHDANEVKKNVWSYPAASSSVLPHLNNLNDALAECTVFAERSQEVTQSFSRLNPFRQTLFIRDMKQRLRTMNENFGRLMSEFRISSSPSMALFPTGRYTSFESIADSQLIGIDEQEKKIRNLISDNSYKAIGVYGMGGSGKTALILKVLNSLSQNQFSPIIWLCLSDIHSQDQEDAEFFEVSIVKCILCELGCDVDKWTAIHPSKADLLKHVKKFLMSKKYLIVFDDVWEKNEFYSNLGDALPGSDTVDRLSEALPRESGAKIIITSRQKEVAKNMVGEKNLISMKPLDGGTCRMILEEEIGFTGYAKEIEGLLNGNGFVSIGIYGPSSSANTTLVRKVVYGSPSVREKFQRIIWVPVSHIFLNHSDQKSTVRDGILNIENEIVEYMLTELGFHDELVKDNRDFELMDIVNQHLRSKSYLIVLADVWHKNYGDTTVEDQWNIVGERLSRAWPEDGDGTVIVTTQTKEVAQGLVGEKNLVHVRLPELGANERSEIANDRQYISDDIVDQCRGLPFAVKTLAKIIREKVIRAETS